MMPARYFSSLAFVTTALIAGAIPETGMQARGSGIAEENPSMILVDGRVFDTLSDAIKDLRPSSALMIGPGIYKEALILNQPGVVISGYGAELYGVAARQKGAFLVQKDAVIHGMTISGIRVPDNNGACFRVEKQDTSLSLKNIVCRHSQTGILSGPETGTVLIEDSLFERLGEGVFAHGIYIDSKNLVIRNSRFLATQNEGHEIKTRSARTVIEGSIVASLDAKDSRLIDAPNGGVVEIRDSILQMGPNSANADLISFGVEDKDQKRHNVHSMLLDNVTIIIDPPGRSFQLVHVQRGYPEPVYRNVTMVGGRDPRIDGITWYPNREKAGLPPYPLLPDPPDKEPGTGSE